MFILYLYAICDLFVCFIAITVLMSIVSAFVFISLLNAIIKCSPWSLSSPTPPHRSTFSLISYIWASWPFWTHHSWMIHFRSIFTILEREKKLFALLLLSCSRSFSHPKIYAHNFNFNFNLNGENAVHRALKKSHSIPFKIETKQMRDESCMHKTLVHFVHFGSINQEIWNIHILPFLLSIFRLLCCFYFNKKTRKYDKMHITFSTFYINMFTLLQLIYIICIITWEWVQLLCFLISVYHFLAAFLCLC